VGVVANTRSLSLTEPPVPEFYLHDLQEPQTVLSVLVRAEPPAAPSADAVRAAIWGLDPDLAIASARTLDELADHSLLVPRFTSILVGTFATAALALMAVGLYGLMAMTTAMRLPEIGVRLALGAGRGAVVALLVRHGLLLAIIGAAAGGCAVLPLTGILQSQLPGIPANDPLTWIAAGLVVLITAGLASWWPARRAVRLDLTGVHRREGARAPPVQALESLTRTS
jgi:ABC-type antimicrobial peptide transport system permease subunit